MTEHEALIDAILDEPDDDLRRLVYADWLEEQGTLVDGLRAKLIRLQVREYLAANRSQEKAKLQEEISALEQRYKWLLFPSLPAGFERPTFDRGIIRINVALTAPRFVEWGEDYRRGLPPSCRISLELTRRPGRGRVLDLLDSPAWPLVSELRLWRRSPRWTASEVQRLAADLRVRGLEGLDLYDSGLTDADLAVLAGSPQFRRLRDMCLFGNSIGDAGLAAFSDAGGMPRLRYLGVERKPGQAVLQRLRRQRPLVEVYWRV
jgi:uncharacterized protein (TIGR02996 family)